MTDGMSGEPRGV